MNVPDNEPKKDFWARLRAGMDQLFGSRTPGEEKWMNEGERKTWPAGMKPEDVEAAYALKTPNASIDTESDAAAAKAKALQEMKKLTRELELQEGKPVVSSREERTELGVQEPEEDEKTEEIEMPKEGGERRVA